MSSPESLSAVNGNPPQDDALDRAAADGPLPETNDDNEFDGGAEEHVEDSTDEAGRASILGLHLRA